MRFLSPALLLLACACGPLSPSDLSPSEESTDSVAPAGYYNTVDTTNASTLRSTLHAVIDDHARFPYTASGTDTWDILERAQQDPNNSGRIIDVYKNASYAKFGGGNSFYSREHAWPSSYGFPNNVSSNYPYTDCHHLMLSDGSYNGQRSNKPYRTCTGCTEVPTVANNGEGGPGASNFTSGSANSGSWETWIGRRGDVARAVLYMDVRYEGGTHSITGHAEPDLRLTDDPALITTGSTFMGLLTEVLRWNLDDPPNAFEQNRNDVVFSFQGNRNPFIDHPEWAGCIFRDACPSSPLAAAPAGLVATTAEALVTLDWSNNTESMVLGYRVYRADAAGGPFVLLTARLLTDSNYADGAVVNMHPYFYRVFAVDAAGRESNAASVDVWPGQPMMPAELAFINEIHYDNAGTDVGEAVELAGTAGTNLSGWQLVAYNGSGGASYATLNLSGTFADQGGCFGTLRFDLLGLQNGSPDGIALIDADGVVVEFLSYEGTFSATNGPANGLTSTDLGVEETGTTPTGQSLQRTGSGSHAGNFTFAAPGTATFGQVNAGQTFTGCP